MMRILPSYTLSRLNTLLLLFLVIALPVLSYSQKKAAKNLIPNPSFETSINKRGDISGASPWIGVGTVDYYLKPEKRDTSRFKGARTGSCYAGLRFQKEYKEYMYVPLVEALKEGQTYHFEMYARLLNFNNVTVTIKQLGACFSEESFRDDMEFFKENIVDSTNENGLAGTLNWMCIHGDYIAHGGEKYVILGNFRAKMKDDFVKKDKVGMFEFEEGYYYVDDVSLYPKKIVNDSSKSASAKQSYPETFTAGQTFEIKNIQFEEGGARILRNSYKTLNELIQVFNNHPFMEIQLNLKTESQSLAKARVKAISDYFTEQGVVNPVKYKGIALPATAEKGITVMEIVVLVP